MVADEGGVGALRDGRVPGKGEQSRVIGVSGGAVRGEGGSYAVGWVLQAKQVSEQRLEGKIARTPPLRKSGSCQRAFLPTDEM